MKHSVYLAGPISHLTYDQGQDWRTHVATLLDSDKIETLSPLRGKSYLKARGVLTSGSYDQNVLSTAKGVMGRDHFDCTRADVVLINLLGATKVSIGTMIEIGFAFTNQIPIVIAMDTNDIHNHIMVNEAATYIVRTLEEAVEVTKFLLNDKGNK